MFAIIVTLSLMAVIWLYHFKSPTQQSAKIPLILSLVTVLVTGSIYLQLGSINDLWSESASTKKEQATKPSALIENAEQQNKVQIQKMQDRVRQDKQNGESWYALGNAYMYANQFEYAATAFLYAERLAKAPQANIYAARATALYYANNQRMNTEIDALIQHALAIDKDNVPTLMLVASNHFLNAEYQDAINTWQHALDTGHIDADRVAIIQAINQAKALLPSSK